jgi:8-oxo-dGTP pyrophosphatase MutT (NUDIX family)
MASTAQSDSPSLQFALALLTVHGRYVLQLRDDKPGIAAPGLWGLFGGQIDDGEDPHDGFLREVHEELAISPTDAFLFWRHDRFNDFRNQWARYWVFQADVTEIWPGHTVLEGQAAGLFRLEEIDALKVHPFVREIVARCRAARETVSKPAKDSQA